jgi:glyoxylase-like metal-dependent hydrolase (beta-lactamase superfamily II)
MCLVGGNPPHEHDDMTYQEVADGVFRLILPLGIHGMPSVNGYLIADPGGDTLVDCGIAVRSPGTDVADDDGTSALEAALLGCGSGLGNLKRLVITHAHIDHFGVAGEVVRRTGADLWMHAETDRDLAKYLDPSAAVDRRALMLADHGLAGDELGKASEGLTHWMPVMPSVGRPSRLVTGGETFSASGRQWTVVPTPGHSPGHICLWSENEGLLCSGDHLLRDISPPVTFERGFERDPMGSFLDSLALVQRLSPALVLPGHGETFHDGAGRAAVIEGKKRRRLSKLRLLLDGPPKTVADITEELFGPQPNGSRMHMAMAEVLAYLAYFEVRGEAQRRRDRAGIYRWRGL